MAQQEYIDLFRAVEITEEAFVQLTNKRLEFSIREASTLGNMRIIDDAYYKSIVSPSIIVVLFSFFFSIFLSILFGIIRGVYFLPISNPAEILDNGVSTQISGVLPKSDLGEKEKFDGALESLIVNLQTQLSQNNERCKLISFTSPTASNGKSYVSRAVSRKLAELNNKVLLIDLDLKRGDQHKEFDCSRLTMSDFNSLNEENIDKLKVDENLYLIPKIKSISNTFQFVFSNSFNEKIEFLKKHFDYIIFDTAPILYVSDTSFILQFSDIVYGICRHGLTRMNEIRQMDAVLDQIGVNLDGIIYNFYEKPKVIMVIMVCTEIIITNTMHKNIYMEIIIMIKRISSILICISLASCSISPGMHMQTSKSFNQQNEWVYIESIDKRLEVKSIEDEIEENNYMESIYRVGNGDQISITVWDFQIFSLCQT